MMVHAYCWGMSRNSHAITINLILMHYAFFPNRKIPRKVALSIENRHDFTKWYVGIHYSQELLEQIPKNYEL